MGTAKRITISATGFPGNTKTLTHLQEGFEGPLEALAHLAGDNTIVSGVKVTGTTVSDGYIALNGTIYPVEGGEITNPDDWGFVMVWDQENALYDTTGSGIGTESLPAYQNHYLKLMNSQSDYECTLSSLTRLKTVKELSGFASAKTILGGFVTSTAADGASKTVTLPFSGTLGVPSIPGNYIITTCVRALNPSPSTDELNSLASVGVAIFNKSSSGFGIHIRRGLSTVDLAVEWMISY